MEIKLHYANVRIQGLEATAIASSSSEAGGSEFQRCSFTNCVFQLSAPTPVPDPPAVIDDFSDVDLNELFDFLDLHLLLIIERY